MESTVFGASKNILIAPELAHTIGCIVGNDGVEAGDDGRKVIKAGTPVGGGTNVLENRQTVLKVTNNAENGSKSQGVILHDVDVTKGNANATLIVAGVIDTEKLDKKIDTTAQAALTKIIFQKGVNK